MAAPGLPPVGHLYSEAGERGRSGTENRRELKRWSGWDFLWGLPLSPPDYPHSAAGPVARCQEGGGLY